MPEGFVIGYSGHYDENRALSVVALSFCQFFSFVSQLSVSLSYLPSKDESPFTYPLAAYSQLRFFTHHSFIFIPLRLDKTRT